MLNEVVLLVLNGTDPRACMAAIDRAARRCAATSRGLVVDITTVSFCVSLLASELVALMTSKGRPLAVNMVVSAQNAAALKTISLDLAAAGVILGDFTDLEAATRHALRERRLAELESAVSSASNVLSVRSIRAIARA